MNCHSLQKELRSFWGLNNCYEQSEQWILIFQLFSNNTCASQRLLEQSKQSFSFLGQQKTTLIIIIFSRVFQNHSNNSAETKKTIFKSTTLTLIKLRVCFLGRIQKWVCCHRYQTCFKLLNQLSIKICCQRLPAPYKWLLSTKQ